MIAHKFRGRLDRGVGDLGDGGGRAGGPDGGAATIGVNAEDGSRTDEGFLGLGSRTRPSVEFLSCEWLLTLELR